MSSALFTAVTGLQAFQRKLNVIANNIANVNTTGYRGARVLFQDLFSQTLSGGSPPVGSLGSTNPQQIGLGVRISSIDIDHTQGSLASTGNASDLAIQGNRFFILSNGAGATFTRDGSFGLSTNGFLEDSATGFFVQGYSADITGAINTNGAVGNIQIPVGGQSIVQATTITNLVGNLSAEAESADPLAVPPVLATVVTRTIRAYDSLGVARDIDLIFTKVDQIDDGGTLYNAWEYRAEFEGQEVQVSVPDAGALLFNSDGSLHAIGSVDGANVFTASAAGTENISIPLSLFPGPSIPDTPMEFEINFSSVTELSGGTDITNPTQDGFPRGVLQDYTIGENGLITGIFTNGLTRTLGQVALATFSNLGGLARIGNNQFVETPSSGLAQIGTSNTGGRGSISGGVLESSNVDLATEFSNMIIAQRGFQAIARTITAAD
ncbi:MAG: flagellar hook protein FlgE, partial [Candidatus Hydrogenedentota bacterium]